MNNVIVSSRGILCTNNMLFVYGLPWCMSAIMLVLLLLYWISATIGGFSSRNDSCSRPFIIHWLEGNRISEFRCASFMPYGDCVQINISDHVSMDSYPQKCQFPKYISWQNSGVCKIYTSLKRCIHNIWMPKSV